MPPTLFKRLAGAARDGNAADVDRIFKECSFDRDRDERASLYRAAELGNVDVAKLLLKRGLADPACGDSDVLCWAARHGQYNVFKLFLEDGRANPADGNSRALRYAAQHGHVKVVKLIFQDGRADPTARDGEAMRLAMQGGHKEVVALFERAISRLAGWNSRCGTVHIMLHVQISVKT